MKLALLILLFPLFLFSQTETVTIYFDKKVNIGFDYLVFKNKTLFTEWCKANKPKLSAKGITIVPSAYKINYGTIKRKKVK